MVSALHIFDLDGTLLRGSACLDLSRHVGQLGAVTDIERRWSAGEVGHFEFYELCLPLWTGLTEADIEAVFASADWLAGIQEVWADIARRGEHSAVITLSPQFFADRLLRWGVGSAHGAEVYAGVIPDADAVLTPEDKARIAHNLMDLYGISEVECVAYGDSASDIPLFRELGNTVAVNGSEDLREVAWVSFEGSDLRGAYRAGRELLHRRAASGSRQWAY